VLSVSCFHWFALVVRLSSGVQKRQPWHPNWSEIDILIAYVKIWHRIYADPVEHRVTWHHETMVKRGETWWNVRSDSVSHLQMTTLTLCEAGSYRFHLHSTRQELHCPCHRLDCRTSLIFHPVWMSNVLGSERYPPSFYKTLRVHVCTQEWRSGFWMDVSMPNYTLHGCLHGYDLSVTYALQPKLKMLCVNPTTGKLHLIVMAPER